MKEYLIGCFIVFCIIAIFNFSSINKKLDRIELQQCAEKTGGEL